MAAAALQTALLMFAALLGSTHAAPALPKFLEMNHQFDDKTVYWPGAQPFVLEVVHKGLTEGGYWYEANTYSGAEHGGTHLDAPCHFSENGWTVDEIPLERLVAPAVVVDISARALDDRDTLLTEDDLLTWEEDHGKIPEGAVVFMNSGWDQYWPNKTAIFGNAEGDTTDLHFPGFEPTAVEWLVGEREVVGLGVDTPSIDHGPSTMFQAHVIAAGQNIYNLENVKNLGNLPQDGATVYVMPMRIVGGSGAPTQILAVWGNEVGNAVSRLTVSWVMLIAAGFLGIMRPFSA